METVDRERNMTATVSLMVFVITNFMGRSLVTESVGRKLGCLVHEEISTEQKQWRAFPRISCRPCWR
jgi:hypothetical protein